MDNIVDFEPMSSQYGIRAVQSEAGITTLQAVPMNDSEDGVVAGQVALAADESYAAMFINGSRVYVVSTSWNYGDTVDVFAYDYYYPGTTRVTVYDFNNVTRPIKRGSLDLEGSYSSITHPDLYAMIYPYYYSQGEFHRLGQNTLVLIDPPQNDIYPVVYGVTDDVADGTEGSGGETEKVIRQDDGTTDENDETTVSVVDLSDPDTPAVASRTVLTHGRTSGFFVNNGILNFSYFKDMEDDARGRPQVSYFLGRLDLNNIAAPVELDGIDIPGPCLNLSANGKCGYTLNMEWNGTGADRAFSFNTIQLGGNEAVLLDKVALGSTTNSWYYGYDYVLTDSRACFSGFGSSAGSQTVLTLIDTSDPRNLKGYDHDFETSGWMSLLDGSGTWIFARVSDSIACYDTGDPGVFSLDDYRSPGGWGNRIVFSGGKAYVPMGYYGLWVKPLGSDQAN